MYGIDKGDEPEKIAPAVAQARFFGGSVDEAALAEFFGKQADRLIEQEVKLQDAMWGKMNERADISKGQLFHAGHTQVAAVLARRFGNPGSFDTGSAVHTAFFPKDWDGFRSYGGDIPNLVVAVAYLRQEIKRLMLAGEDPTRLSRTEAQAEAFRRQDPGPAFTTADPDWRQKAGVEEVVRRVDNATGVIPGVGNQG